MELNLSERFIILTHKKDKAGFNLYGVPFTMGLISAMLFDLINNEDITIKENKIICNAQVASLTVHPLIFTELLKSKKSRKLKQWFTRLNGKANKFKNEILEGLSKKYIIEIEQKKFLGLIPYKVSRLTKHQVQAEIISEIKAFVLANREITDENKMVLSILAASKSTRFLGTDRAERKVIRKKLKTLNLESDLNNEMTEAIKQMQAVMAAVMVVPVVNH